MATLYFSNCSICGAIGQNASTCECRIGRPLPSSQSNDYFFEQPKIETCDECKGKGKIELLVSTQPCKACCGKGTVEKKSDLTYNLSKVTIASNIPLDLKKQDV